MFSTYYTKITIFFPFLADFAPDMPRKGMLFLSVAVFAQVSADSNPNF